MKEFLRPFSSLPKGFVSYKRKYVHEILELQSDTYLQSDTLPTALLSVKVEFVS